MQSFKFLSLMLLVGLVFAENSDPTTTLGPKSVSASPSTATDAPKTSTSSVPPSSTTTAPSTTTPRPSSSTTQSPSSPSTSPSPSTTPAPPTPTPKPAPKEFFWNVTEGNETCILAKADIKLSLTYFNDTSKQEVKRDISVPESAISSGHCGFPCQILTLTYGNDSDTITFNFTQNEGKYYLAQIDSNISVGEGANATTISLSSGNLNLYNTHMNTSYACSWSEPATLQEDDDKRNTTKASMKVTLRTMRFEAFRNTTEHGFSKEYSCPFDTLDIVPVMVGIALGILVAVVLIAYLVGRRSTQAQGYLSM